MFRKPDREDLRETSLTRAAGAAARRQFRRAFVVASAVALLAGLTQSSGWLDSVRAQNKNAGQEQPFSLQLISPGPTSVAVYNQAEGPKAYTARIDDAAMRVRPERVPFSGIGKGLRSVAVVVQGAWTIATPDAQGLFRTEVDLTKAPAGPLVVDVYGWDVPPDTHAYKVALNLRIHLFVVGGQPATPAAERPAGHPAHGRKLVWEDRFDRLSPKIWYAGPKPDGQEYGAAAFLRFGSEEADPYKVMDGFLRLRASHLPARKDPAGWNRVWVTGHLSTGFPDGSASAAFRKGYFEARMLVPSGAGTWPSFWLLDQHGIRNSEADGAVEIDVIEGYGHSTTSYVATEHDWPPPSAKGKGYARAQRNITGLPDGSLAFRDYGVEITDDEVIYYYDGIEKFRAPLYRKDTVSPFFLMTTLAMSHDWPITVPPSGYYDLWIDHIRVYQ